MRGPGLSTPRLALLATTLVASVAVVLAMSTSASAAPGGGVEVSPDGATYAAAYPGTLFGTPVLVPGGGATATLWVRNGSTIPAYLRIVTSDVRVSDPVYGAALSLKATGPGIASTAISLAAGGACSVLANGLLVEPGGVVPVRFSVLFADLGGKDGQGGWQTFNIGVSLSQAAFPTANCSVPALTVSGITPTVDLPTDANGGGPLRAHGYLNSEFNTVLFDSGLMIVLLFAAFGLGAGWFLWAAKRRRREDEEKEDGGIVR